MKPKTLQQGYTLIAVLFVLVAVTLFGVTSVKDSSLQLQMSQNQQDYQRAFQAAEAALRHGERKVAESLTFSVDSDLPDIHEWPVSSAQAFSVDLDSSGFLAARPQVVISQPTLRALGSNATGDFCERLYPITSFAVGEQQETRVVLRSYFAVIDDCSI